MAFSGLALSLCVIAIVLSGILEFNTLFLLAAAAFFVGIIQREFGTRFGLAFFLAAILLGFILAPNKLYCITFGALALYILLVEVIYPHLAGLTHPRIGFWILKYLIFNLIYLPVLFLLPTLIFPSGLSGPLLIVAVLAGQLTLLIYDSAYEYFQKYIWNKYRKRLGF